MPAHKNPTPLTAEERRAYEAMIAPRPSTRRQLAEQAFALAFDHMGDDWPRARGHLEVARRYVLWSLGADGRRRREPTIDLWFAAELIARTLEADVGLTESEIVALFDAIDLPVDTVPQFKTLAVERTPMADAIARLASEWAAAWTVALCPRGRDVPHDCWNCRDDDELDLDDERSAA